MGRGVEEVAVKPGKTLGLCGGADMKEGRGFGERSGVEKVRGGRLQLDEPEAWRGVLSSGRV